MITHVVLFQPKVSATNEELTAFFERVQALQQVIPVSWLSQSEKTAASTMEGLRMGLSCTLLMKPTCKCIILIQHM